MYNLYVFRVVMLFLHISGVFLFIRTNATDFLKRFEDMATDYGFSDDRKIRRVQKYCEFDITQRIQDLDSYEEKDWKGLIKEIKAIYKDKNIN